MSFLIGVLGSVVFWIIFFIIEFFIGSVIMKYVAPKTYKYILTGNCQLGSWDTDRYSTPQDYIITAILIMIFSPIIIIFKVVMFCIKIVFVRILWPSFRSAVKASAESVPEFEIKKEKSNAKRKKS